MVYGVFGGMYSDWWVLGYFTDKANAEAFCKRTNENTQNDYYELYIKELPNLEDGAKEERMGVYVDTDSWGVRIDDCVKEDRIIDCGGWGSVYMMIYPSQYDRAAKIAQDRWAQYKAEKEGIT